MLVNVAPKWKAFTMSCLASTRWWCQWLIIVGLSKLEWIFGIYLRLTIWIFLIVHRNICGAWSYLQGNMAHLSDTLHAALKMHSVVYDRNPSEIQANADASREVITPRGRKRKPQILPTVEWGERGDGPVLGALFLVALLGQVDDFRLNDLSETISGTAAFEMPSGETNSSTRFLVTGMPITKVLWLLLVHWCSRTWLQFALLSYFEYLLTSKKTPFSRITFMPWKIPTFQKRMVSKWSLVSSCLYSRRQLTTLW